MYFRIGMIHRRSDLSREEFGRYWRNVHAPLVCGLPGIRCYQQNRVLRREPTDTVKDLPPQAGDPEFEPHSMAAVDGVFKLGFDSAADMASYAQGRQPLVADERNFADSLQLFMGSDHVVIAPQRRYAFKRISLLTRAPSHTPESFVQEWHGIHADLVRQMPGCGGYVQNRIEARHRRRGEPASYEQMPYDGVAELYFEDEVSMKMAYTSPARTALRQHARTLLGEILTFIVQCENIV